MLSYQVSRSIEIEKTQSEIIDYLKDFTHWPRMVTMDNFGTGLRTYVQRRTRKSWLRISMEW